MKKLVAILWLAGCFVSTVGGQPADATITSTNEAGQTDALRLDPERTRQQIDAMFRFQTEVVASVFGVDVAMDGVIPRILRTERPWQLINPLAPPEYGIGAEILSINSSSDHPAVINRKVEGFSFFTFRF